MLIGVLSDSHDQIENILRVVEIFNQKKVELVVHCGDWVAPFTLGYYKDLKCPIKGIFGNNDGDKFRHIKRAEKWGINVEMEERFMELEVDGRKIAMFHGDYEAIVEALVICGKYDAVFHGHNHKALIESVGDTLSLNPGTLMPMTDKDTKGASFAIYDSKSNTAELIKL